jgi:DNA primase
MSVISEVKQRTDITELISEYVALQKSGRNFKGLCPFHSEKHASFFVFPEQQTWHCFGACGTGGDVFSFVMKKEGVDFGQALRELALKAGVALSSLQASDRVENEERQSVHKLNEMAAEYYHHLLTSAEAGQAARSYLERRDMVAGTIKDFRLGFSPDAWETIKDYLLSKGCEENELLEAGLVIEREGGGSYDRFRNRLMFPICNSQGQIDGFGARALDDSLPKYINSPQTAVFDKSGSLYGIDKAKSAIRKTSQVIIVEGYTDVLTAHQHGWKNVVGSMGTALTEKQVAGIRGLADNITLALDADLAGEEATLRGSAILAHSNAEANVIMLPPGKDPDEVIREDPGLWGKLIDEAVPMLDFAFRSVIGKVDISRARDKSLAVRKLLPSLLEIRDPVQQSHYLQKLARELKIDESAIRVAMREEELVRRGRPAGKRAERARSVYKVGSSRIEESCLALLLQYPELRPFADELSAQHFECTENRELFVRWQRSSDVAGLESELDAGLKEHLSYLMIMSFPPGVRTNETTRQSDLGCRILRLREIGCRRLETEKQAVLEVEREKGGVSSELSKLEEQGIGSAQQLREVFEKKGKRHWIQLKERA